MAPKPVRWAHAARADLLEALEHIVEESPQADTRRPLSADLSCRSRGRGRREAHPQRTGLPPGLAPSAALSAGRVAVLMRDLPEHGLRAGDLGAVVELYGTDGVEVEFVRASGQTKALVTLKATDARSVGDGDMLAVRSA